jgi:hypothetical protein
VTDETPRGHGHGMTPRSVSFVIALLVLGCGGSVETAANDGGTVQDGTTPDVRRDGSMPQDSSGAEAERMPDGFVPEGCLVGVSEAGFDAGAPDGAVIGTPCIPSQETSATFDGYNSSEINLDGIPAQSGAPTCLVDHFQGLVTCPYGQNASGDAPTCAAPCTTIGGDPVLGAVEPQCVDRLASKVVLWSCRCANAEGRTDDGDTYCTCPVGLHCVQLISSIGDAGSGFAGGYCATSAQATGAGTCGATCDPATHPCP